MSTHSIHEIAESLRKAPRRGDVLLHLDVLLIAHAGHLAELVGISPNRVVWIMEGRLPYYRIDRSLVALELARQIEAPRGRAYAITGFGRRVAGELRAERAARARRLDAEFDRLRAQAML